MHPKEYQGIPKLHRSQLLSLLEHVQRLPSLSIIALLLEVMGLSMKGHQRNIPRIAWIYVIATRRD